MDEEKIESLVADILKARKEISEKTDLLRYNGILLYENSVGIRWERV